MRDFWRRGERPRCLYTLTMHRARPLARLHARLHVRSIIALALAATFGSTAVAQIPANRFSPRAQLDRFLPEDLPALEYPAYFGDLEKARALLFHGRYRAAFYACSTIRDADAATDVALIRGEALWHLGRFDLARQALSSIASDARSVVLQAQIDLDDGHTEDAIARLRPLVDATPDAVAPRHWLAVALERKGDLSGAVEVARVFAEGNASVLSKFQTDGAVGFESAEDLTLAASSIDRWAAITMAYAKQPTLHDTILSMFVGAYDVVDREYWPAHVAAAEYLFAHGNKKAAGDDLSAANGANPNAEGVNELMGTLALDNRSEGGLAEAIRSLRNVDPTSFRADLLSVRLDLMQRAFANAMTVAQRCVERQPTNTDALALLACAFAATGDDAKLSETLARVDAIDPHDASARVLVADVLETVYYDSAGAVKQLETAVDRAPWWTTPQHQLGIAYIQDGDENKARLVLGKAYEVDPYNLLTVNYLRVLDEMSKFKEYESGRFIFRFAESEDPIVPLYIAPQMDATYDDLVKQFKFAPEKKPIIEIFPDAQGFSVRTAGRPGLETYGASLGRVMTVVAPRAGETLGPFNWPRVLRHEFTHTLNLTYTHGRVPRWLTEGLAVWQEHVPYRFPEVPEQLYKLASEGKMPTPGDMRQVRSEMDYMTSFWIVRYIDETKGWDAVLKLLDGYRAGKEEDDVFKDAVGSDVATFHAAFSDWAKAQVKDWGYDKETGKQVETIEKEADGLTKAEQYEPAIEKWEQIAKLQPMNPTPTRRLAGLYLRLNRPADALPHLIATLPLELQDDRFAKRAARLYDTAKDPTNAMKFATFAIGINPYDPDAHELLATLYEKANDAKLTTQERDVAKLLTERKEKSDAARK